MKRNTVLITMLLVLGAVLAAVPASAQVQFTLGGSTRALRIEGLTEAVGPVSFVANSVTGTVVANSTISVNYGTAVNLNGYIPTLLSGGGPAAGITVTLPSGSPNVVILTWNSNQTYTAGYEMVLTGVRVDAHTASGQNVVASVAAEVPAASQTSNAITFTGGVINQAVGTILTPSTTVTLTAASPILTCNPSSADFTIEVDEGSAAVLNDQVFTSASDEFGLGGTLAGSAVGTTIEYTFTNIPVGVTITYQGNAGTSPTLTAAIQGGFTSFTSTASKQSVKVDFLLTSTSTTGANEQLITNFSASGSVSTLAVGVITPGTVTVSLVGGTSTQVPQFAANTQVDPNDPSGTIVSTSDCVTNLLFPWIAVSSDVGGTYDTGIAIANTTMDPFGAVYGAKAQSGSCTMNGYPAIGGSAVTYTTGAIAAGQTLPVVLSTTPFLGFEGYIIAVCQFQNAHAFAFITQDNMQADGTSQGYLGLVIPTPSRSPRNPAGRGKGESLGN